MTDARPLDPNERQVIKWWVHWDRERYGDEAFKFIHRILEQGYVLPAQERRLKALCPF